MKVELYGPILDMDDAYRSLRNHIDMYGYVTIACFNNITGANIESADNGCMGWTSLEGTKFRYDHVLHTFSIELPDPQPVTITPELMNSVIGKERIGLGMNEYQALAARTINDKLFDFDKERHALHGMVGEIGELHSLHQKTYQGHELDREHAKKELGDLLWFIAEYCTANGWDLGEVAQMNIDKLKARYPEGFEVERSLNRAEGDI